MCCSLGMCVDVYTRMCEPITAGGPIKTGALLTGGSFHSSTLTIFFAFSFWFHTTQTHTLFLSLRILYIVYCLYWIDTFLFLFFLGFAFALQQEKRTRVLYLCVCVCVTRHLIFIFDSSVCFPFSFLIHSSFLFCPQRINDRARLIANHSSKRRRSAE